MLVAICTRGAPVARDDGTGNAATAAAAATKRTTNATAYVMIWVMLRQRELASACAKVDVRSARGALVACSER